MLNSLIMSANIQFLLSFGIMEIASMLILRFWNIKLICKAQGFSTMARILGNLGIVLFFFCAHFCTLFVDPLKRRRVNKLRLSIFYGVF